MAVIKGKFPSEDKRSISELAGFACLNNIALECNDGRISAFVTYGFAGPRREIK